MTYSHRPAGRGPSDRTFLFSFDFLDISGLAMPRGFLMCISLLFYATYSALLLILDIACPSLDALFFSPALTCPRKKTKMAYIQKEFGSFSSTRWFFPHLGIVHFCTPTPTHARIVITRLRATLATCTILFISAGTLIWFLCPTFPRTCHR